MKHLEPSWLHRRRGWQLGHAPAGAYTSDCPGDESLGVDMSPWIFAAGLLPGVAALQPAFGGWRWVAGAISLVMCAAAIVSHIRVYSPFQSRERFARARIRRHECVICGVKLPAGPSESCSNCDETSVAATTTGR